MINDAIRSSGRYRRRDEGHFGSAPILLFKSSAPDSRSDWDTGKGIIMAQKEKKRSSCVHPPKLFSPIATQKDVEGGEAKGRVWIEKKSKHSTDDQITHVHKKRMSEAV